MGIMKHAPPCVKGIVMVWVNMACYQSGLVFCQALRQRSPVPDATALPGHAKRSGWILETYFSAPDP